MKLKDLFINSRQLIIAGLLLSLADVSGAFGQNTLKLAINKATYTIHKEVYGGLLEDWGRDIYNGLYVGASSSIPNTNGMRNDIIEGLKECKIGILQYPGGCHAEVSYWYQDTGTKSQRTGGEMVGGMGTDEYFQLCSLVNATPFIQCNYRQDENGDTSAVTCAKNMASWLRYIHTKHPNYDLKYLGIGNEPWGGCYTGVTVDKYLNRYDTIADSIPSVYTDKLVRVASAGYATDIAWHTAVIKREVGNTEGLSWHYYSTKSWTDSIRYSSVDFSESDYYGVLAESYEIKALLATVIDTLNRYDTGYTVGLQPDEWGAWYKAISGMGLSFQQSTVRDAQVAAFHLNLFNNNCRRIKMAQVAQPVNAIQSLFLTKKTASTSLVKTPTFYVYKMFSVHQNSTMIPSTLSCGTVSSMPVINESASIDSIGVLHIGLSNIHATSSQTITITLSGETEKYSRVSGEIITGPSYNSHNGFDSAENVNIQAFADSNYTLTNDTILTVNLPAHSVVMMTLASSTDAIYRTYKSKNDCFTVSTTKNNKIIVKYSGNRETPVSLTLYGVDGRRIVGTFNGIFGQGRNSIVWQPKNIVLGSNIFVLKLAAGNITKSQRVVFSK